MPYQLTIMSRRALSKLGTILTLPTLLLLTGASKCGSNTFEVSKVPSNYTLTKEACEVIVVAPPEFHEQVKPLADLISKGEGDYNAVNRGYAGDTPQGIKGLTGSSFAGFTVAQVVDMQRTWLYAVGRYQFIPRTLRFAVNMSDVNLSDKFNEETQDKLFAALLEHKRPAIAAYLRGDHNYLGWALDELAREWASVEYRYGRGYYDHIGGNRAHISRSEASQTMTDVRSEILS